MINYHTTTSLRLPVLVQQRPKLLYLANHCVLVADARRCPRIEIFLLTYKTTKLPHTLLSLTTHATFLVPLTAMDTAFMFSSSRKPALSMSPPTSVTVLQHTIILPDSYKRWCIKPKISFREATRCSSVSSLASIVQNVECYLLLLVASTSDLLLHTIKFRSVFSSSAYSLMHGGAP